MTPSLQNIIISRTDSIGDVILTLPLAKVLKDNYPGISIAFLGRHYTKPVIDCCEYVDEFIELNDFLKNDVNINGEKPQAILHVFPVGEIAKRSKHLKIPLRIGTTNRLYHWTTCNKLVRLSRKNSDLHEAQLNLKLLAALNIQSDFKIDDIKNSFGFTQIPPLEEKFRSLLDPLKYNLILHPKSQGSAREWGLENFIRLIELLNKEKYHILISGTEKERALLDALFNTVGNHVTDITGLMDLSQFISFINHCDGLVANSTGPLHIAAILGKQAFGIYPPIRPMHPGRWAPLGMNTHIFVSNKTCNSCLKKQGNCECMTQIKPEEIIKSLELSSENLRKLPI